MLFITMAHAEGAVQSSAVGQLMSFAPLALVFVVFYFLLIRPQQKKAKEHQVLLNSLKIGTTVVAAGGIFGKITKVNETDVVLEIAPSVQITVLKGAISDVVADKSETVQKKSKVKSA